MKALLVLSLCFLMLSCQIAYVKSIPPPEVEYVIVEPLPPVYYPVYPLRSVKTIPIKPKAEKVTDRNTKRPKSPSVKRSERPDSNPSKSVKKEAKLHTR